MATRKLDSPPSSLGIYGRALLGVIPGTGSLPLIGGCEADIPQDVLELDATAERERVARYCKVCGFTLRNTLPPTYPHILAFPLHMAMVTDRRFPYPAAGLVHISNSITQKRPVEIDEPLTLRVRFSKLEPHQKGKQFTIITEARAGAELVWESTSTNLRRGRGEESARKEGAKLPDPLELPASAEWKLRGDLGRSYGAVSGDRNPIHMYGLTAKAFGFPRAIAHGMWTKARALAALEGRLGETFTADVRFLRPILLPSRVTFASDESDGGIDFGVRNAKGDTPHLTGRLTPAA